VFCFILFYLVRFDGDAFAQLIVLVQRYEKVNNIRVSLLVKSIILKIKIRWPRPVTTQRHKNGFCFIDKLSTALLFVFVI